ncbi:MAG: tautomerase family protein [Pseudomonadota bacterium]|jgi:4-oxalocrotonate tautomerase
MPFVTIRIVKEVIADDPVTKKTAMSAKIVAAIAETAGISKDDVWVVFEEIAARDWFVGDASVQALRDKT